MFVDGVGSAEDVGWLDEEGKFAGDTGRSLGVKLNFRIVFGFTSLKDSFIIVPIDLVRLFTVFDEDGEADDDEDTMGVWVGVGTCVVGCWFRLVDDEDEAIESNCAGVWDAWFESTASEVDEDEATDDVDEELMSVWAVGSSVVGMGIEDRPTALRLLIESAFSSLEKLNFLKF